MSHTHRSPLLTGVARTLRYAPRNARAELGRVTTRRVRRATLRVLSRLRAGHDADGVVWPLARAVADVWTFD